MNVLTLLLGMLIGFVICIPVGPINLWVVNTYLKKGAILALTLALGASVMDFFYFYTILSGLSFISFSTSVLKAIKFLGVGIIFVMGVVDFLRAHDQQKMEKMAKHQVRPLMNKKSFAGFFFLGMLLYISNPTLAVTMSALGALVKGISFFADTPIHRLLVSVGLSLGTLSWFVLVVVLLKKYHGRIAGKYFARIQKGCGLLMIVSSLVMGYRLCLN